MKYTKQQRLEIGRQIHESGVSDRIACEKYGISEESARQYRIFYEETTGIEHIHLQTGKRKQYVSSSSSGEFSQTELDDYSSMTKEQLINEIMKAKIREARLKKGYMVKGVGADKEYILLDSKNIK